MIDYNRRGCWLQLVNFAIRGHDVRTSMNRTFFLAHGQAFLLRPRACPRVLGCGARRGAACTPRRKFGPRPGSVARAPGPQSRASWQAITGSLSAEPEPTRPMENPKVSFFQVSTSLLLVLKHYHGSPQKAWQRRYISRASSCSL